MKSINPACKFVGLLAITFLLAAQRDGLLNLTFFFLSVILILLGGTQPIRLFIYLIPIFLGGAGMFFTGYHFAVDGSMPVRADLIDMGSSALWNGITLGSRVLAFGGLGYLFALTTQRIALVRSFQKQFRLPQIFAYGLLAAFGVFPQMVLQYRLSRGAFAARGIRVSPLSPALLKVILVKSVRWSEELAIAMESKGFSGDGVRSEYAPSVVRTRDWLFLVLCCIVIPVICVMA